MKNSRPRYSQKSASGYTLVEITVTISILLSLIGIVTPGVRAYNKGTDRALCIMNIQSMQKAVSAFGNMYQHDPGETVPDIMSTLIGVGGFFHKNPDCPGGGNYSYLNIIPQPEQQFMSCSIADHILYK